MAADTTILIVEDEPAIVELVSFTLRAAGWNTFAVNNTAEAWGILFNVALRSWFCSTGCCLTRADYDCFQNRSDRQFNEIPVIMLTAKSMEEDKIAGLDHGADDCHKAISPRELTARIGFTPPQESWTRTDALAAESNVVLDPISCTVKIDDQKVDIGHAEYKLLKFFMAHPERVFT